MSDPIIDIIREAWSITGDDMYFDENLAMQIRQQIGRELFEYSGMLHGRRVVEMTDIREVCQLEES